MDEGQACPFLRISFDSEHQTAAQSGLELFGDGPPKNL